MKLHIKLHHLLLLASLGIITLNFHQPIHALESDGTAAETTTLNIKSKYPFVDLTKFQTRDTIAYQVPQKLDDGIRVANAKSLDNISEIISLLNRIEKQNQDFKQGKGKPVRSKKRESNRNPPINGCIDSVLIAKDGKLILEEYFADANRDKPHYQMSITKSIVSYAIGKAIEQGHIKSDQDLILQYLPEVDKTKIAKGVETLKIADLLTMSSGIRYKVKGRQAKITKDNHAELYLINTTPITKNKQYKYDGANLDILCHILYNTTGQSLSEYTEQYLFGPMGINNFKFGKSICGLDKGAAGMSLRSRDMMKIALMTMDDGKWNDKQILNPQWIEKATAVHVNQHQPHQYGYFWWSNSVKHNGKTYRVRSARGAGGQFIFMVPELKLAAVFTSYYATNEPISLFANVIIPAFDK
ncbi:serine hydrolase [Planctomycetota bacterium]|nr:serine hydrolase [Planctomycetota bacterium]